MTLPTTQAQRAIAIMEQLSPDQLAVALEFLEQLAQQSSPRLNETHLREIIHQSPKIDRQRLNDLRDRNEWDTLTPEEHEELLQYEEQLEKYNGDRLQAMIQLAQLKNIDLPIEF